MGFLMKRNDRGIIPGGMTVHDFVKNLFPELPERAWRDFIPEARMSIKLEPDAVKVQFPCSGCKRSDFDIEASGTFLTVKVSRRNIMHEGGDNWHYTCCERSREEYQESVRLPVTVIPSEAKAKYTDGVLEISLPRVSGNDSPAKQIQVQ